MASLYNSESQAMRGKFVTPLMAASSTSSSTKVEEDVAAAKATNPAAHCAAAAAFGLASDVDAVELCGVERHDALDVVGRYAFECLG